MARLDTLEEIIRRAGALALRSFGRLRAGDVQFKSEVDLVTAADREVEAFLCSELGRAFPGVGFLGEETATAGADPGPRHFLVDPIDGTASFVHGLPHWSVSVALKEHGETVAGLVYAPALGDLYTAERGGGARKNGTPLAVSAATRLLDALGSTGFACVRARRQPDGVPLFARAIYRLRGIRRYGSAAIDLSLVAEGKLDLYWELNIKPWDIAAGILILEEAGGRVTDYRGGRDCERRHEIVASNGRVHGEFLALVREVFPAGAESTPA